MPVLDDIIAQAEKMTVEEYNQLYEEAQATLTEEDKEDNLDCCYEKLWKNEK